MARPNDQRAEVLDYAGSTLSSPPIVRVATITNVIFLSAFVLVWGGLWLWSRMKGAAGIRIDPGLLFLWWLSGALWGPLCLLLAILARRFWVIVLGILVFACASANLWAFFASDDSLMP